LLKRCFKRKCPCIFKPHNFTKVPLNF
jgi:hypothetical protein